ncbi:MAG: TrkA family potassium uptake protein [Bacteroidetes bacterium]|nr:MAG: TrkA family potassium uptake protein [Bacteroidota bacterium]
MSDAVAVIGLGRFGSRLARRLHEAGREVIALDRDRAAVERIRDSVRHAVVLDATDSEALKSKGVAQAGVAFVAIGEDFEANVLVTVTLRELGVPRIFARARSLRAARVLRAVGAENVVMAEDEAADRWADRLLGPRVLNQIEFHEGHSIVEIPCPAGWAGHSLAELHVRAKFGVHVVAIRTAIEADDPSRLRIVVPGPTRELRENDVLIIMGRDEDIARLPG